MPDRTTSPSVSPEEMLDRWLDSLNEPGRRTPPPASSEIANAAAIALRYRAILGVTPDVMADRKAHLERNGSMNHALPVTTPNGTWRTIQRREPEQRTGWLGWLSNGLATAAVIGLLIALVGGTFLRQNGLPGGSDEPTSVSGVAASPETTPVDGALSCGSPGYRPVILSDVESSGTGPVDLGTSPIVIGEDAVTITMADGEELTVPRGDASSVRWNVVVTSHKDNARTVTRLSDGKQWNLPATDAPIVGNDRYLITPTDDSLTNLSIIDTVTGDQTTSADILGAPFALPVDLRNVYMTDDSGAVFTMYVRTNPRGSADDPPTPEFPGVLVIPGSLADAYFTMLAPDTRVSPDGELLISVNEVFDAGSGERLYHDGEPVRFDGLPIGFTADSEHLLVIEDGKVRGVDLTTGSGQDVFAPEDDVQIVGHDRTAQTMVVGTGADAAESWAWVDLATGERNPLPELDGYELSRTSLDSRMRHIDRIAQFNEASDENPWLVRGLDMATGQVSGTLRHHVSEEREWIVTSPYLEEGGYLVAQNIAGEITVLSPATDKQVNLGFPPEAEPLTRGKYSQRVMLSPNGACLVLTIQTEGDSASFVTPIQPAGEWTELPFAVTDWVETPELTEPETLPAQDFATPLATPQASGLSCSSPGYRPVVAGDIDPDELAMIGGGEPIVRNGDTTITAANGEEITFDADTIWTVYPGSALIVSGETQETLNTLTSLATGESWTFPALDRGPNVSPSGFVLIGPWLVGATDESATDWRVIDTSTGVARLTSEMLGAPFAESRMPFVSGPWVNATDAPAIVAFSATDGSNLILPVLVLPSPDLDDAWALDPPDAAASGNGVITSDGSRIAYVAAPGGDRVVVLDGFTGERLAYYRAPETRDILQVVGLTGDDSKLVLRDGQQVWTVDLATGELTTVFDPEGAIHSFEFDATTGAALASSGDGQDETYVWIDPATVEVKTLDPDRLTSFPFPQFGWALIQTRDDFAVDYALLDMATGELATDTATAGRDENGSNAWITGGDESGVYVVQAEPGVLLVLDGPGGRAFELPVPESDHVGWSGVSIGVSPNKGCLVYTLVGTGDEPGTSWVAPLEPGAGWTELPFELAQWVEIGDAPEEPQTVPAQNPTTPTATSEPTPNERAAATGALDPDSVEKAIQVDIDGLLAGDENAEAAARQAIIDTFGPYAAEECRAGFVLSSARSPSIEDGIALSETVNALLVSTLPDVFGDITSEAVALPVTMPYGEVQMDVFFYLGCPLIAAGTGQSPATPESGRDLASPSSCLRPGRAATRAARTCVREDVTRIRYDRTDPDQ